MRDALQRIRGLILEALDGSSGLSLMELRDRTDAGSFLELIMAVDTLARDRQVLIIKEHDVIKVRKPFEQTQPMVMSGSQPEGNRRRECLLLS